jgi:hypothetical protein
LSVGHYLKRGLSALLDKCIWVETGGFNIPASAVPSKRPVNTCRHLVGIE